MFGGGASSVIGCKKPNVLQLKFASVFYYILILAENRGVGPASVDWLSVMGDFQKKPTMHRSFVQIHADINTQRPPSQASTSSGRTLPLSHRGPNVL